MAEITRRMLEDNVTAEPYHEFFQHGSKLLQEWHSNAVSLFFALGCLAAFFHYQMTPTLCCDVSIPGNNDWLVRRGATLRIMLSTLLGYVAVAMCMVYNFVTVGVLSTVVFDGFVYALEVRPVRPFSRVSLRLAFLACFCLVGRDKLLSVADQVDYMGPMRVLDEAIGMYRPNQITSSSHPTWYYSIVPIVDVEWGDAWGCPNQQWCRVENHFLDEDACASRRIVCEGRPLSLYDTSGCSPEIDDFVIESQVRECLLERLERSNGTVVRDFFERRTAPWEDADRPYTMEFAGNCETCDIVIKTTPQDAINARQLLWYGIIFMIASAAVFGYGKRFGNEDENGEYQTDSIHDAEFVVEIDSLHLHQRDENVIEIPADNVLLVPVR